MCAQLHRGQRSSYLFVICLLLFQSSDSKMAIFSISISYRQKKNAKTVPLIRVNQQLDCLSKSGFYFDRKSTLVTTAAHCSAHTAMKFVFMSRVLFQWYVPYESALQWCQHMPSPNPIHLHFWSTFLLKFTFFADIGCTSSVFSYIIFSNITTLIWHNLLIRV